MTTEQALLDKQRMLTETQRIARIGSWEWNIQTDCVTWSEETFLIFGIKDIGSSPTFETFIRSVHPDDRATMYAWIDKCIAGIQLHELEFRIIRPNGEICYVTGYSALKKDGKGNPYSLFGVVQDVTERKKIESERAKLHAQLLQAQKMEAIGHLAGGIAHDFNNVLGIILGNAQVLRRSAGDSVGSTTMQQIERVTSEIANAGSRAKELISQMLLFSRAPAETAVTDAPEILVESIIKEVVQMMRASIPSTIELKKQLLDCDLKVKIQPVHLHQVLLNLIVNARDAVGEYGNIDVRLERRLISDECGACHHSFAGDYVSISVSDSGRGISTQILPHIFDPFFTTKEMNKGSGMGLSVVHGVVHAANGHILINTNDNSGVCFQILFPVAGAQSVEASTDGVHETHDLYPVATEYDLAGLNILVVDDEPSIAALLKEFLEIYGASVSTCHHPLQAIAEFESAPERVDLLITDETMPVLSGMDLTKRLLQIRPTLPVILCTGYSEHVNAEVAAKQGIFGFMQKPVNMDELLSLIQTLAQSNYSRQEPTVTEKAVDVGVDAE